MMPSRRAVYLKAASASWSVTAWIAASAARSAWPPGESRPAEVDRLDDLALLVLHAATRTMQVPTRPPTVAGSMPGVSIPRRRPPPRQLFLFVVETPRTCHRVETARARDHAPGRRPRLDLRAPRRRSHAADRARSLGTAPGQRQRFRHGGLLVRHRPDRRRMASFNVLAPRPLAHARARQLPSAVHVRLLAAHVPRCPCTRRRSIPSSTLAVTVATPCLSRTGLGDHPFLPILARQQYPNRARCLRSFCSPMSLNPRLEVDQPAGLLDSLGFVQRRSPARSRAAGPASAGSAGPARLLAAPAPAPPAPA